MNLSGVRCVWMKDCLVGGVDGDDEGALGFGVLNFCPHVHQRPCISATGGGSIPAKCPRPPPARILVFNTALHNQSIPSSTKYTRPTL